MIFSKLQVLFLCCLLPTYSYSPYDCTFSNYCHHYASAWWTRHANFCFGCTDGKKYHCARDYDSHEVFREGCAVEKNCSAGEEPRLSFKESGKQVTEPVVYCKTCFDDNYYNPSTKPSSEYSECPNKKWNDCSKEKHKIYCKPDNSSSERYCRCDARNGYSPINDFSYQKCSYKNYDCKDYNKCDNLQNGKPQQRLLNYTCAAYCEDGFDRLDEDSDDCLPIPKIKTTRKPAIVNISTPEKNITTVTSPPTRGPTSTTGPLPCDKDCDEYQVCVNGTCVCRDVCSAVYDPVCGYDAKSDTYRTFPSDCALKSTYCIQKQFRFHAAGKCKSGTTNTKVIAGVIGGVIGFLLLLVFLYCCYRSRYRKKCTDRFCPYPALYRVVIKFTSLQFTEEMQSAEDIGQLSITRELQTALQNQLSSLRGGIQIDIKAFKSGSLMVIFYIKTDGHPREDQIIKLLKDTLKTGKLSLYTVSSDGFEFRRIEEPFHENIEMIVQPPGPTETPPDIVVESVVDGKMPNGKHVDRQLSAPLSEHEDVSTPNLSSKARKSPPPPLVIHETTNIYHGTVIQSKGGNTQISLGEDNPKSKNRNLKVLYNKDDVKEGEDEPLIGDSDSNQKSGEEDSHKQSIPVEVHSEESQIPSEIKPSENLKAEDVKVGFGDNSATIDNDPPKETLGSEVRNVEADAVGKLVTKNVAGKDSVEKTKFKDFKRTPSMSQSHESLLSPQITNVKNHFKDNEQYKKLINKVIDLCLRYMLENMDPNAMLTVFPEKDIFEHTDRRDISDINIQTERSKKIMNKIRETGTQYYQKFKECLSVTKQFDCLAKIEKVQSEVLAELQKDPAEGVYKQTRHSSGHIGSLPNLCSTISDSQSLKSEHSETITEKVPKENISVSSDRSKTEFEEAVRHQEGNNLFCPSDVMQSPKQGKRKPTYVPPVEETMEEKAYKCLRDLTSMLEISGKEIKPGERFKMFKRMCEEIREQLSELTSELLIPGQLSNSLPYPEKYQNMPQGFQSYRSSGKDNSCLYQSISLLLNGTENLQYSLRLLATLHAVESYKMYKKQLLEIDLEDLKLFFCRHVDEGTYMEISEMDNVESVTDLCLQLLIMDTACLGIDSSELHVGFLSGALGMKIHQHFQYGRKECEIVPWEKIIQGLLVESDLPGLHIFWVNHSKHEKGRMNHIVPLLQNGDVMS